MCRNVVVSLCLIENRIHTGAQGPTPADAGVMLPARTARPARTLGEGIEVGGGGRRSDPRMGASVARQGRKWVVGE